MALVHHLTRKYTKHPNDYEEIRGHCLVGLTKALNSYDKDRPNRFYSYAYHVIKNEIVAYIRNKNTGKEQLYLTAAREQLSRDGECLDLFNAIPDPRRPFSIETRECVETVLRAAKEKDRIIFHLYLLGYKDGEIGNMLHLSRVTINGRKRAIMEKIKAELLKD